MHAHTRSTIHGGPRAIALLSISLIVALALAGPAWAAATTKRVSVRSNENQANGSSTEPVISRDGRFVVFSSEATNLVIGDTNEATDVFVRDRRLGTTKRVSVRSNETQGNGGSQHAAISSSGRFVVFDSSASNLVVGDGNNQIDVFVRDLELGTTRLLSVRTNGNQGNGASYDPSISGNGRFAVFTSESSNLVGSDTNDRRDVFLRNLRQGTTVRVSLSSREAQGDENSQDTVISADGDSIVFLSSATNLVPHDINGLTDVFVRARVGGTTRRISVSSSDVEADGDSDSPTVSAKGRFVAFQSQATNLVAGDGNPISDVFLRDRQTNTTRRVSLSTAGAEGDNGSNDPSISANGRYVAFSSDAANLVENDTNLNQDIFIRDRINNTTSRISLGAGGGEGDGGSFDPDISGDGRFVVFESSSTDLVTGDTNETTDVFIRGPLL
jgi:Tol biopolymer transport system component